MLSPFPENISLAPILDRMTVEELLEAQDHISQLLQAVYERTTPPAKVAVATTTRVPFSKVCRENDCSCKFYFHRPGATDYNDYESEYAYLKEMGQRLKHVNPCELYFSNFDSMCKRFHYDFDRVRSEILKLLAYAGIAVPASIFVKVQDQQEQQDSREKKNVVVASSYGFIVYSSHSEAAKAQHFFETELGWWCNFQTTLYSHRHHNPHQKKKNTPERNRYGKRQKSLFAPKEQVK